MNQSSSEPALKGYTKSYIYGPGGLPVEQINNTTEKVQYLHHDQAGSTRLITGSTGTVEGAYTYDAYGNTTGHTGTATTSLGYDGQYTSTDTGLIYMRNRVYDPAAAQFLTVDPLEIVTRVPYGYGEENPLNRDDATGLSNWNPFSESFWTEGNVISESPLNPIPYYEQEIESYENGCGYFASVTHGLEGALAGTALFAGGEGEDELEGGLSISSKIAGQMENRGWTTEEIEETVDSGEQVQAVNKANGNPATRYGNPATRYISPKTGQSVVVDDVTKEVIHVGGPGFRYGPGSGDLP